MIRESESRDFDNCGNCGFKNVSSWLLAVLQRLYIKNLLDYFILG